MRDKASPIGPCYGAVVGGAAVEVPTGTESIARSAEAAGFEWLAFGDSQSICSEPFVNLAVAALATTSIRLGTCVTNVVTRHPAVVAAAICSVDELSQGRAVLGVGVGDSAVLNLGLRPAKLHELGSAVDAMRAAMSGAEASVAGGFRLSWVRRSVPIFISAEGPEAVRSAAAHGDGLVLGTGFPMQALATARDWLSAGLAESGRSLSDIEVWHMARGAIAHTRDEAIWNLRSNLASMAHHGLCVKPAEKGVPAEYWPKLAALRERYDPMQHSAPGDSANAKTIDQLGLTEYLAERYAIAGDEVDCAQRICELYGRGVERLLITVTGSRPVATIEAWGRVFARVKSLLGGADAPSVS